MEPDIGTRWAIAFVILLPIAVLLWAFGGTVGTVGGVVAGCLFAAAYFFTAR